MLTGFGCQDFSAEPSKTETQLAESPDGLDLSTWKQASLDSSVRFSYPSELVYAEGGDIDTGSYSWVQTFEDNTIVFTLFESALLTCTVDDPDLCNLGTLAPGAEPEEVYTSMVESLKQDPEWVFMGEVQVGNTVGIKFVEQIDSDINPNAVNRNTDGSLRSLVVFKGSKGVYEILDMQTTQAGGDLFEAFLSTFRVE